MQFQFAESIFLDVGQDVEEIAARGDWPRAGWSEAIQSALVKQFGLEVPISNLAIRRNQLNQFVRGERKLANNLVRFIDTLAMTMLTTDVNIQTQASAAAWTVPGTDIIAEVASAQEKIETQDNGYNGFAGATLVLSTFRRAALLNNTVLRNALPREDHSGQIQSGMIAPFLGVKEILFTPQLAANTALVIDSGQAGVIADERPDPVEGFAGYDPGPGFAPIYVKVYEEPKSKDQVIAAGRWPAMALTDPKAVVKITGV
jgi:hypothetical protein